MPDDWLQRVQAVFEQALQQPAGERGAYLDQACGDDAALRAEVESLLAHDAQAATDFLRAPGPPACAVSPTQATETEEAPRVAAGPTMGLQIEGYEIVRELGRGGQAVVYEALQRSTKRKVALKVLLEGALASKATRRRFEREIELVAQLRHPNIISIFHSGMTADGRHFYVMDYVRGKPLHQFVRDRKLALEDTLRLFATVCDAVQYAHQRGVIHRDLKPNNILVEADGVPKVTDFGLAKLLAAPVETVVSLTEQVVGTLPYMSPEQARGNPDEVDTRTDIYALGVILYELLTGHYPYPVAGQILDVLKHITETPPALPSRQWSADSGVARRSSGKLRLGQCPIDDEVQTILLRTLAKERERRYQGAGELAGDIRRYLKGEPIEAKRDSGWYVAKKTLRRFRAPIGCAGALLLGLGFLAVTLAVQARRIAGERDRADRAHKEAVYVNERLHTASRALIWHELVREHFEDIDDVWGGVLSYVIQDLESQQASLGSVDNLRNLRDELRFMANVCPAGNAGLRCFPVFLLQDRDEHNTLTWLTQEELPLSAGDRLRCIVAASQASYFAALALRSDGTVECVYPQSESQSRPAILVYVPDTSCDQWWSVEGPPGRVTWFIFAAPAPLDLEWLGRAVAAWGHPPVALDNAFVNYGVGSTGMDDLYWQTALRTLQPHSAILAIASVPVAERRVEQEKGR